MHRRDVPRALIASVAGVAALSAARSEAQTCTPPCFPITQAEVDAGVSVVDQSYREGHLRRYGAAGDGSTSDTAALIAAANQNLQPGGVSILISGGTYRISASVTIPAGTVLDFSEGGKLIIDAGATLTIRGSIIAPNSQIFDAPSGSVVFGVGSVTEVYPDWWGAASGAINKAVAAVTGKYIAVRLSNGKTYPFSSTLALAHHGDAIVGPAQDNDTSGGNFFGATLEYTGSGTALLVGIAPGASGDFIYRITLEGFLLKVTDGTAVAIRLWHLAGRSRVREITVRGNTDIVDSNNVGVLAEGCIDTELQRVLVFGQGAGATGLSLLENGFLIRNGFSNSPTTTLRLVECYASQCRFGCTVMHNGTVDMISCVFESCHNAGLLVIDARVNLFCPWFEANGASGNGALRLQGNDCIVTLSGGRIDIGTNRDFIQCENNNILNLLGGTVFASSHANPRIVLTGGTQPTVAMLGQNIYPANFSNSDFAITKLLRYNAGSLDVPTLRVGSQPPASATSPGSQGTITWDTNYLYVCVAANTWKRASLFW